MALLLAQARNVPQAHAALNAGRWERSAVGGRRAGRQDARHRRPRPHRQARRRSGPWRSACASSPTTRSSSRRAGPADGRRAASPLDQARRRGRLPHHPPAEDAGDDRADRRRAAGQGQARAAHHQRRPRRHRRRGRAGRGDPRRASSPAPRSTCSPSEPTTESPLFELDSVVVTPHLGRQHPRGAGQGRRHDRRAWCMLALAGEFVPFAVNVERGRGVRDACGRSCRWPSGSAGSSPRSTRARPTRSRSRTRAQLADYDTRILTLSVLKGVLRRRQRRAGDLRQRAAARQGARRRGPRGQSTPRRADYVNLITVRGGDHVDRRHARRASAASRAS